MEQNDPKRKGSQMTQGKGLSRWSSIFFVGIFATALIYLALSGQTSIYS